MPATRSWLAKEQSGLAFPASPADHHQTRRQGPVKSIRTVSASSPAAVLSCRSPNSPVTKAPPTAAAAIANAAPSASAIASSPSGFHACRACSTAKLTIGHDLSRPQEQAFSGRSASFNKLFGIQILLPDSAPPPAASHIPPSLLPRRAGGILAHHFGCFHPIQTKTKSPQSDCLRPRSSAAVHPVPCHHPARM